MSEFATLIKLYTCRRHGYFHVYPSTYGPEGAYLSEYGIMQVVFPCTRRSIKSMCDAHFRPKPFDPYA